jgi:hypothetical protein
MMEKDLYAMHEKAKKRKRRIINLFDCIGNVASFFMMEAEDLVDLIFVNMDAENNGVDSIIWDTGYFYWENFRPVLKRWQEQGKDILQKIIDATKKRGIECMINYRMNRVAWKPARLFYDQNPPYPWEEQPYENTDLIWKKENPDACLHTWWHEPLFNYESEKVRNRVLKEITGLMNRYDFDGLLLDFSRHVPLLPPGRQWLLRDCITSMIADIKKEFTAIEKRTERPVLLCAKVPENEKGCKIDGFDVKKWVKLGLIDLFVLGSRTMNVDIDFYRKLTENTGIQIYPCIDAHHATDGYRSPGLEWYAGLVSGWLSQGADGYTVFNFSAATPDDYEKYGMVQYSVNPEHRKVLCSCTDLKRMKYMNKKYVVERKWGYPWSEGYFNQNKDAPLPAYLTKSKNPYDGHDSFQTVLYVSDDLAAEKEKVKEIKFSVLYGWAFDLDKVSVKINGIALQPVSMDENYKDPQIRDYGYKKPVSGGTGHYTEDPNQKLVKVYYGVSNEILEKGKNFLEITLTDLDEDIKVEKIELEVLYL